MIKEKKDGDTKSGSDDDGKNTNEKEKRKEKEDKKDDEEEEEEEETSKDNAVVNAVEQLDTGSIHRWEDYTKSDDATAPLAPEEEDYYYEPVEEKKEKEEKGCIVKVEECSQKGAHMSDEAAVACMGVHLNGVVALPQEKKCTLITEYDQVVKVGTKL